MKSSALIQPNSRLRSIMSNNIFVLLIVLVAIILFLSLATKYFFSWLNLTAVLNQTTINGIQSIGMTLCIIATGIDLSVGSVLSFSSVVLGVCLASGLGLPLGILCALLAGILSGSINGVLVTKGKLPPFIATLGMMSIASGVALILSDGRPISGVASDLALVAAGKISVGPVNIPITFLIMLVLFILVHYMMRYTRTGRYFYMIGGNTEAARLSGIKVNFYRALPFAISGLMAAIAGIIMMGRLNSADPVSGTSTELDAVAATIIGGTSMAGGEGKIMGTLIGALIMSVIRNGMVQLGIGSYPQQVVIGSIIIIVVMMDTLSRKK